MRDNTSDRFVPGRTGAGVIVVCFYGVRVVICRSPNSQPRFIPTDLSWQLAPPPTVGAIFRRKSSQLILPAQ